jgi:hypothetical protein
MKDHDRQRILNALLDTNSPRLRKILEAPCLADLERIEPVIDSIVKRDCPQVVFQLL